MQFFPSDWSRDTRALTPAARGIWIDILCALHNSPTRGVLVMDVEAWARVVSASPAETGACIAEIGRRAIAEVESLSNGDVRISCRRMMREEQSREGHAKRQERYRKKASVSDNGSGNGSKTPASRGDASLQKNDALSDAQTLLFDSTLPKGDAAVTPECRGRSQKPEAIPPIIPQGDKQEKTEESKKTELQIRAEKLFRRKLETAWGESEKRAWKKSEASIKTTHEDDWRLLEWFYSIPAEGTYRRRDLATLLNNWGAEIDRARDHRGSAPSFAMNVNLPPNVLAALATKNKI